MEYININSKKKILNKIKLFIEYYNETYKINKEIGNLEHLNSQNSIITSKKMLSDEDNKHEVATNLRSSAVVLVYGTIPAGIPMECIEDIIDTEEISTDMLKGGKQYFGLKIKGNSMFPEYLDGDTIILEKVDDVESGTDACIMVNGNDGTFKRVFKNENGIILQPLNNEFQPMVYSNEQIKNLPVKVIGKVVELRRKK